MLLNLGSSFFAAAPGRRDPETLRPVRVVVADEGFTGTRTAPLETGGALAPRVDRVMVLGGGRARVANGLGIPLPKLLLDKVGTFELLASNVESEFDVDEDANRFPAFRDGFNGGAAAVLDLVGLALPVAAILRG